MKRTALYFTFFNDLMGYAIVFPVVVPFFLKHERWWGLTALIAVYAAAQIVSTFTWHSRSLPTRLTVVALAYIVTGFGVLHQNLALLFAGRILGGLFAGNSGYLAFDDDRPARWTALAGGLGMVAGPLLAGFLADESVAPWCSGGLPFWIMAAITLINLALVSNLTTHGRPGGPHVDLKEFLDQIRQQVNHRSMISLFAFLFAWFLFIQWVAADLFARHQLSESQLGISLAIGGCGWCLGSLWLNGPKGILLILAVSTGLLTVVHNLNMWIALFAFVMACSAVVWNHMSLFTTSPAIFRLLAGVAVMTSLFVGAFLYSAGGSTMFVVAGIGFFVAFVGGIRVEE